MALSLRQYVMMLFFTAGDEQAHQLTGDQSTSLSTGEFTRRGRVAALAAYTAQIFESRPCRML